MSNVAGPVPAAPPGSGGVPGAGRDAGSAATPGPRPGGARRARRRAPSAGSRWGGMAEVRADVLPALRLTAVLGLAGVPAGLLWWLLAPREDYRVLPDGGVEPLGQPSPELFAAVDGVFVLIMAGLGLVAGVAGWLVRRLRGVTALGALAVGTGLAGVLAWQLGELLAPGPDREQLAEVGATVTTRIELASPPALAVGPFVAVGVYVMAALLASAEDLGRTPAAPGGRPTGPRRERASGGGQGGPFFS